MAHVIDYVERAVDDLGQAKAFYAKALGWAFNDYGPHYAGIQDPRNPAHEFGGLTAEKLASRGEGVLALVRTDDADDALAPVLEAGGRLQVAFHEYPGGRRFTFADPSGRHRGFDRARRPPSRAGTSPCSRRRPPGRSYANGNSDAGPEETRRIYGDAKVARLAALKRVWDPDNVFHVNPDVAPGKSG